MYRITEREEQECIQYLKSGLTNLEVHHLTGLSSATISRIRIKNFGYKRKSRAGMKIKTYSKGAHKYTSHYQFKTKPITDDYGIYF